MTRFYHRLLQPLESGANFIGQSKIKRHGKRTVTENFLFGTGFQIGTREKKEYVSVFADAEAPVSKSAGVRGLRQGRLEGEVADNPANANVDTTAVVAPYAKSDAGNERFSGSVALNSRSARR